MRCIIALVLAATAAEAVPARRVRISGQHFIDAATNETLVMKGPNGAIRPRAPRTSLRTSHTRPS